MASRRDRGQGALDWASGQVASAGPGERANVLFATSVWLASLAKGGQVDEPEARAVLEHAAHATGLQPREIEATLRSAWRRATPKEPDPRRGRSRRAAARPGPAPVPRPFAAPDPPRRLRSDLIDHVWDQCRPVGDDPEVSAFLEGRALPPDRVVQLDVARALPHDARLPRALTSPEGPWTRTGHQLVVLAFDATGQPAGLHSRAVRDVKPKTLWPRGCSAAGLVFASGAARWLLGWRAPCPFGAPDLAPWSAGPPQIVICEGATDFLSWSCAFSDADQDAPAVFGIASGSWTPEIAAKIPNGSRVTVATDADRTGNGYAAKIGRSLVARVDLCRYSPAEIGTKHHDRS